VRPKIADLSMVMIAAFMIGGAHAAAATLESPGVTTVAALDSMRAHEAAAAGGLSAAPYPLREPGLSASSAPDSFRFASMPGRWLSEFSAPAPAERPNLFFSLRTSDFVTMARYAASEPLTLADIGLSGGLDAWGVGPTGQGFMDAAISPSRPSGNQQPDAYAMLLAGLVLIGLMARRRLSQD
jgi:hypothetical protein